MSKQELVVTSKGLLIKISVITGWALPQENLDVLIDFFSKKMLLAYPNANKDEVEYAFLIDGNSVKDWGKYLNLALIDEVLMPYFKKRFELSKVEEQIKIKEIDNKPKEDLSDKAMSEWMEEILNKFKQGDYPIDFIPLALYDWLDKKKEITATPEEKRKYIQRAVERRFIQLSETYEIKSNEENKKKLSEFAKMKESGVLTGSEMEIVRNMAKKILLHDLFQSAKLL